MIARCLVALLLVTIPASAASPRKISLTAKNQLLSTVLAELAKQSGIAVERRTASDPLLTVDVKDLPFWQALDQIAQQAGAAVSLYERGGALALVDGPSLRQPVSYAGVFRTSVKRLSSTLDLGSGKNSYNATLDLAWEPAFHPFYVECRSGSVEVLDEKNQRMSVPDNGTSQYAVTQRNATEFEILLPALPRSVARIALLRGTLSVLGTPRMADFRLGPLDKVTKGQKATEDQATLTVRKIVTTGDPWSIQIELTYPEGGPHFESYQSWLVNNELYLEGGDGKTRLVPSDMAIDRMADNFALVTYYFKEARTARVRRGSPSDWRLVATAPTSLLVRQVPFEFKNVPLP